LARKWLRATLTVGLTLLAGLAVAKEARCVKTLAWSDDPPHTMRLPDGSVGGVEIALHRELLATMGCELRLAEMPFARALSELRAGRVDVIPATLARPERKAYARFSKPLLYLHNVLYVRAEDVPRVGHQRLADLVDQGWRLGGQVGVVYSSEFAALLQDPVRASKLEQVPYRPSLWKMLDHRRVDGVLVNQLTAAYELRQLGLQERIRATSLTLPLESGGSAWSRLTTDEAFVQRFDQALNDLRQRQRYAELLAPYGLTPSGQMPQARP
jgi:polar amino acid transport system substrate-binding protein